MQSRGYSGSNAIIRVLHAGVHAVALERGRCMGGIAREQDAPDPISTRYPGVRAEKLRFIGGAQRCPGRDRCEPRADGLENMGVRGIRPRNPAGT
jgi:hypothetical protein